MSVWRTPADPAAVFHPSAAAAIRKKIATKWEVKWPGLTISREGYPYESLRVDAKLWAIIAATLLLPSLWAVGAVRRWRRRMPGLCPACGYDLRATPDRCPECGRVVASC